MNENLQVEIKGVLDILYKIRMLFFTNTVITGLDNGDFSILK